MRCEDQGRKIDLVYNRMDIYFLIIIIIFRHFSNLTDN